MPHSVALLLLFAFLHADGASIFKQHWTLLTVGCAAELGIAENLQMRIQVIWDSTVCDQCG